ncbi:MAG: thiamine phosphate synthase [Brumimicrobium sp.]
MDLSGLYIVINPKQDEAELFEKLGTALEEGIVAVQLYNGWPNNFSHQDKVKLTSTMSALCKKYNTPFFINNEWQLLKEVDIEGVHFDQLPENWLEKKATIGRSILTGLTMTNDLSILENVKRLEIDYLSFCAMFPSASVGDCEIVDPKNVAFTLQKVTIPVFISGGVTPKNMHHFKNIPVSGVAVISGVMNSEFPAEAISDYKKELSKIKKI